jgi:excalibur calcium-binding domain-containing protein
MKVRPGLAVAALATAALAVSGLQVAGASTTSVQTNCKYVNSRYAHGVGKYGARDHVSGTTQPVTNFKRSNRLYYRYKSLDRDKDGIACEKL